MSGLLDERRREIRTSCGVSSDYDTLRLAVLHKVLLHKIRMEPKEQSSAFNIQPRARHTTYSTWFTAGTTFAVVSSSSRL